MKKLFKRMTPYFAILKTSLKSSTSLRWSFLLESFLMVISYSLFAVVWWLFFDHFKTIGDWTFHDVMTLNIVCSFAYGMGQVFLGGVRDLAKIILRGTLDLYLSQPKNTLLKIVCSRSLPKGWGSIFYAIFFTIVCGFTDLKSVFLLLFCSACSMLIFFSCRIIYHSLAFWLGEIEELSERLADALFLFSFYPTHIYKGFFQFVMFTLIPAGCTSFLPVDVVRHFSYIKLFTLSGITIFFVTLAFFVFNKGLKRYESGNQFLIFS
jgi:ABC-2 type transport system permease protein